MKNRVKVNAEVYTTKITLNGREGGGGKET